MSMGFVDDQRSIRVRRRLVPRTTTASSMVLSGSSTEGTSDGASDGTSEMPGRRMSDSRSGWRRISLLTPERSTGADASSFVRRCAASRVSGLPGFWRPDGSLLSVNFRDGLSSVIGIAFPCVRSGSWILSARGWRSLGALCHGDTETRRKRLALTYFAVAAEKWRLYQRRFGKPWKRVPFEYKSKRGPSQRPSGGRSSG